MFNILCGSRALRGELQPLKLRSQQQQIEVGGCRGPAGSGSLAVSQFTSCDETLTVALLRAVQGYFEGKLTLRARWMGHFCIFLFCACLFLCQD